MSTSVHLRATTALLAFRANLQTFTADAIVALRDAERELRRLLERLSALERQTQQTVGHLEERVSELESALAWCEDDCDDIADDLAQVQHELDQAERYLQTILHHNRVVEERGMAFLREQRRHIGLLETNVSKGAEFLVRLRDHIERYGQVGSSAAGLPSGFTLTGAGSMGAPSSAEDASLETRIAELQREGSHFFGSGIPTSGVASFNEYKSWSYVAINTYMRTGELVNGMSRLPATEIIPRVKAMEQEYGPYSLGSPATLYRGVPRNDDSDHAFRHAAPGEILPDPGFMSTSLKETTARGFMGNKSGYVVRIRAPRGLLYIPLSTENDGFDEAELVLPPGSRLVVTGSGLESGQGAGQADTVIDTAVLPPQGMRPTYTTDIEAFAEAAWKEYAHELKR